MQPPLTQIISRADLYYAARSEIKNVHLSIELLSEVAGQNYEAAWRLGRALFFLGQEAQSPEQAREHHAAGIRAGARAVRLKPLGVEGHFWLGVNLALNAQTKKHISALFLVWLAKRSLRRAARIDPGYHAAGPLRVLACIQHKLPRVFGGGYKRARANFERALQLSPENTVTRIYFAELLLEIGEKQEARTHLEAILNVKTDPAWDFEARRDRTLAKEKLARMNKMPIV